MWSDELDSAFSDRHSAIPCFMGQRERKEMAMNRTIVLILALSGAVASCAPTHGVTLGTGTYDVIDLGVHPGFDASEPSGINSVGQVSGFSSRNNGTVKRAFFYDTPRCQRVDVGAAVPEEASSDAMAINDSAVVVGSYRRSDGRLRAFAFSQGVFRDLGGDERLDHHALAVNKSGQIVGFQTQPVLSIDEAVAYANGQAIGFPFFGNAYVNNAAGISDSGEVTGPLRSSGGLMLGMKFFPNLNRWYQIRAASPHPQLPDFDRVMNPRAINANGNVTGIIGSSVPHAFLSRNHFEPTRDLGTIDPAHPEWFSVAYAINAAAHVVGVAQTSTGITAFLHNGTTMTDLNTRISGASGWRLIGEVAINDKGLIAAQASLNNGPNRAVLLLPASRVGPVGPLCPPSVFG
jgi:probable HAF family extracellular repeat protein